MNVQDSIQFWNALKQKIRPLIKQETNNCVRVTLCEVVSAPNGETIGVKIPDGNTVMNIPYSIEVENATVGSIVMVVWHGSMSTAKAYYYNYGFIGSSVHNPITMEKFVFSLGSVVNSTQTIWTFAYDQNGKEVAGKVNSESTIIAKPFFAVENEIVYMNVLNQFYDNKIYASSAAPYENMRIMRGTTEAVTFTSDFKIEVLVLNQGG